ncbi:hypothetical protein AAV96_03305 [Acinetobacter sp. AG1]|uniref:tape measure protein n=1 Tax=Acinetobacter sp. AG1 TaxID=348388 RepID=UPI0006293746|nr:tape measure protein [Acinetobacter sp. AG1]KKW81550.1 hypothetical protein AAV96_03305 [Acinetobacter sp. AG1]
MSKELVFKVVLEGDTKDYVSNIQQSEDTTKAIFEAIKQEAEKLRQVSAETAKQIGEIVPESTTKMASALTHNLNNATTAIQNAGINAGATAKNFAEFGHVSEQALGVLKSDLDQAKQKLHDLSTTNATPQDIEAAQHAVNELERQVEQADEAFNNFTQASNHANQELVETEAAAGKAEAGFTFLKTTIGTLAAGLAALGLGLTINELIATSDATQQMASRLRNATDSVEEYNLVQERLLELANTTARPLMEAQEVYLATAGTLKSLGYSTNEILTLTDSLSLSFTHNATRADQAQSAQDALAQSLAKGSVDADAWMSIITGADNVVSDMAKSTGRAESEIRKLGAEGKISVNELTKALIDSRDRNFELANGMENSTADAMQKVRNNITALIGQMNEQYNISSRLAGIIELLGGDLDWIAVLFDDVMSAVDAVSEKFDGIDPSVFNALRQAVSSAYDAVKELVKVGYELGDDVLTAIYDSINNIVAVLGSFTSESTKASEQVSFLTRVGQGLSITFGAISDVIFALRLVVMTLSGVFYDLAAAVNIAIMTFTLGDVREQFAKNANDMRLKAKGFYDEVDQLALSHQSQVKMRLDQAVESEAQKNARILEENKKALDGLLLIQEQEGQNNEKLQSRKLKAVSDYVTQAVQANDGIINSTLQLELAQKGYFATVDEGGKVVVTRLTEAQQATAAATLETKKQEQSFKNAIETGQALGVDVEQATNKISAGFNDSSGKLTAFAGQLKDAGITGTQASDMIYQAWQKWLSQAKNTAEIDEAKKKLMEMGVAGQITGQQLTEGFKLASAAARDLNPALNDAREAGKALGIDIDKTANIMSQGFGQGSVNLDALKQKLEEAGIVGVDASRTLYEGWKAWLDKADSQVEIDAAKAKLIEFGKQGVLSAKQVEMGMRYLDEVNGKLPANISEVEKAYKSLGITSREEANKMADSQLKAFNVMMNSGTASAENIKQALINMADKIYASGDAAKIAWYEAQLSANGLQSSVDSLGKASVKTMDDLSDSVDRVGRTARGPAADGFRELGRVAREEAKTSLQEWEDAMAKISAERKAKDASNNRGLSDMQGGIDQMAEDYYNRLVAAGMNASQARDKADKAKYSLAVETTNSLKGGTTTGLNTTKQEMEKTLAYWESKNSSNAGGGSISTGGNSKAPVISAPNIQAPSIPQIQVPNIDVSPTDTVNYSFNFNGKTANFTGDSSQKDLLNDFFNELEQAKKAM